MEEEEEEEEPIYASHFLFSTAMCRRLSLSLSIFDNSFSFGSWRGWRQWAEEWAGSCRLRFSLSFNYLPACPSLLLTHHHLPPCTHTHSLSLFFLFLYIRVRRRFCPATRPATPSHFAPFLAHPTISLFLRPQNFFNCFVFSLSISLRACAELYPASDYRRPQVLSLSLSPWLVPVAFIPALFPAWLFDSARRGQTRGADWPDYKTRKNFTFFFVFGKGLKRRRRRKKEAQSVFFWLRKPTTGDVSVIACVDLLNRRRQK